MSRVTTMEAIRQMIVYLLDRGELDGDQGLQRGRRRTGRGRGGDERVPDGPRLDGPGAPGASREPAAVRGGRAGLEPADGAAAAPFRVRSALRETGRVDRHLAAS